MTTHSSILAWKISWTEERGELQSMGSQGVGHDWRTNTLTLLCYVTYLNADIWIYPFYSSRLFLYASSVQFSHSVMSNSLRPHRLQYARPPCPSPIPRVNSNSCPLSRWCHPTISSSVVPFSSCLQSLPASGSFPMSQLFASGGQSTGVSASTWHLALVLFSSLCFS